MKRFIAKLTLFLLLLVACSRVLSYVLCERLKEKGYITSSMDIRRSFDRLSQVEYEVLILGNSKARYGIDPDYLRFETFNFAHQGENFNQIYYNLLHALSIKPPKAIILGVDHSQFSRLVERRNYIYLEFFEFEYFKDYDLVSNARCVAHWLLFPEIQDVGQGLLTLMNRVNQPMVEVTEKGHFRYLGTFSRPVTLKKTTSEIIPLQRTYFEAIEKRCQEEGIPLVVVLLPDRAEILAQYSKESLAQIEDIYRAAASTTGGLFLDFSSHPDFDYEKYGDRYHLSEAGAIYFTRLLDDRLSELVEEGELLSTSSSWLN